MAKFLKRMLCLLLAAAMLISLVACSSDTSDDGTTAAAETTEAAEEETTAEAATREVTDLQGNTLTLPTEIESVAITSWMGAFGAFVLLGQIDKVTCMADTSRYAWLRHAYPELEDLPDNGSFNDVNIEELLAGDYDVIISPASASDANEQMQELGMPVYVDGLTTSDADDVFGLSNAELEAVAELTGTEDLLEEYYEWSEAVLNMVAERVADIPDEDRKTVMCVRTSIQEVFGDNIDMGLSITDAGGINVVGDTVDRYGEVDAESIAEWDPDFIFQIIVTQSYDDEMAEYYNEWAADERYSSITAIQNGDVYIMPMGIVQWNGGTDYPLGVLLMAKLMYPDLFEDIDVKEYAEEFYLTFMGYEMDDEDWEIMAPNFNGANTNGIY